MTEKKGVFSKIFAKGGKNKANDTIAVQLHQSENAISMNKTKLHQKQRGSRRTTCISPGTRRKMEAQFNRSSVKSSPAALIRNGNASIKSAPSKLDTNNVPQSIKVDKRADKRSSHRSRSMEISPPTFAPPIRSLKYVDRESRSGDDKMIYNTYSPKARDDSFEHNETPPIRSLSVRRYHSERILPSYVKDNFPTARDNKSTMSSKNTDTISVGMKTCQSLTSTQLLFRRKSNDVKTNVKVPEGTITIVITDVQGSTKMWEEDPSAMKEALDLHDTILRRCYTRHNGYEITTEGDSFHLAFHHPLDALSFALQAQIDLYEADWSGSILRLMDAKSDSYKSMRGLRVRMGLHHGTTTNHVHKITKRTFYNGEAMTVAKAIESVSHGGQIVTTVETWKAVSGMAERLVGTPQVLDCGEHELDNNYHSGSMILKGLVQLVPKRFAHDYFTCRGVQDNKSYRREEGRLFPPLKTKRKTNTSFADAPYRHNEVSIAFIYTVDVLEELSAEAKEGNADKLGRYIRFHLLKCRPPGYECQQSHGQWMLAFHTLESAISFGVIIVQKLEQAPINVKVGIQHGKFTCQGPHKVTGRADYFGPVVNRAARIASSAEFGQVLVGVPDDVKDVFEFPSSEQFQLNYIRCQKFKGMSMNTTLYAASKKNK